MARAADDARRRRRRVAAAHPGRGRPRATLPAVVGVVALLVSQVCYYVLVWSEWKSHTPLWRAWWVAVCVAVGATHLVWVRLLIGGPILIGARVAREAVGAVRRAVHGGVHRARGRAASRAGAGLDAAAGAGRGADRLDRDPRRRLAARHRVLVIESRRKRKRRLTLAGKIGWLAGAAATLFGVGFYAGRITAPGAGRDGPDAVGAGAPLAGRASARSSTRT